MQQEAPEFILSADDQLQCLARLSMTALPRLGSNQFRPSRPPALHIDRDPETAHEGSYIYSGHPHYSTIASSFTGPELYYSYNPSRNELLR